MGWMLWVHLKSGASVKRACVSQPSPIGKPSILGKEQYVLIQCFGFWYNIVTYSLRQSNFVDPASLALN